MLFAVLAVIGTVWFSGIFGTVHGPGLGTDGNPGTPGWFEPDWAQAALWGIGAAFVITTVTVLSAWLLRRAMAR
jgi:hypothetical protein